MVDARTEWVVWRTLRRPAHDGGLTDDGHPIVLCRGARFVLPFQAHHLRQLQPCCKCGRDVPRPYAVRKPRDIQASSSVLCEACSAAGLTPS